MTGIFAALASLSTSSQPVVTTAAMTIASTPWLMKLCTAAIWFSGLLSAALKISLKPFLAEKAVFIDRVFAARHPDSDPVWANPTVITLLAEPPVAPPAHPLKPRVTAPMTATAAKIFFIPQTSLFGARADAELL